MSDEEDIMKKLQKVAKRDCNFCWQKGENCDGDECEKVIAEKILNIYNRQQAEIERLNGNLFTISNACMQRVNEAIKEFAERLKEKQRTFIGDGYAYDFIPSIEIDVLLAERVGEQNEKSN